MSFNSEKRDNKIKIKLLAIKNYQLIGYSKKLSNSKSFLYFLL